MHLYVHNMYLPGFPVDLGHGDTAWKNVFGELTGDSSARSFFNLGQLELEQVIEECQKLVSTHKVGIVHHALGT